MSACPRGLPRPLETAPDGCLRPIPWTQNDEPNGWGQIDDGRLSECSDEGFCLVCGEFVQDGVVFWDTKPLFGPNAAAPLLCTFADLEESGNISDRGSMHHRCAKLTRAHCRAMRDFIRSGRVVVVPYIGPCPYGRS